MTVSLPTIPGRGQSWTVVYRTGGTLNCVWKRALPVRTEAEARTLRAQCEVAGYKAIIHDTAVLDVIGVPEGWNA